MDRSIFQQHGFELSPEEVEKFETFLALFLEYNSHTNLSAIRDEEGIIEKHFVDSLIGASIISEWLKSSNVALRLLDIWSGGWFPGIPLKIVLPELNVTLLDSVGKKVKAMNYFVEQLWLEKIHAIQERAEILAKNNDYAQQFDFVVSRATAYITDILRWAKPFLRPNGKILLYKMPSDEEDRDRKKILKKLSLRAEWELFYELGSKERVIYVFSLNEDKI